MVKKPLKNNKELVKKKKKRLGLILGLVAFSFYAGFLLSNMK